MILEFQGGLNENPVPNIAEALSGYNFELQKNQKKLRPRKPFDLKGTAPNAGAISGLMQLVKRDATETTLVQAGTSVYLWDGAATFTSQATVATTSMLRDALWALGDYLVITDLNKVTKVSKWSGTAFTTLTTGLGTDLYARYAITHLGRMWLFNVRTSTDTPHLMVASAFEDPTSYSTSLRASIDSFTTGREAFYLLTPDLKPINGAWLFHDQLVISTENGRLFRLTGTSSFDFAFKDFYAGSAALGKEAGANVGNDVMFMRKGGNIEGLKATVAFGDVATDDLSRWIPVTVKDLTSAIVVYDQTNQKVFFFVPGKVLVMFKDILNEGQVSPWSIYRTKHANNFNTSAAKYMYAPGTTSYSVYFGDSAGRIFDLNGGGANGDGGTSSVELRRKTRLINDTVVTPWPWVSKTPEGRIFYRRVGECEVTLSLDWSDEYNVSSSTIRLKGPTVADTTPYFGGTSYFGGAIYFNQGFSFADRESSRGFSPTGKGPGFYAEVSSDTIKRYEIDRIRLT